jgi:protein-S-isoprenylcysteine O-methyltransferase Ste14
MNDYRKIKLKNVFKQLISFLLPVFVLIIMPLIIESNFVFSLNIVSIVGLMILLIGLAAMILTIRMFIQSGEGTLAPWCPTKKLVAFGLYRYVRNPMILGVSLVLSGESLLFRSYRIAAWLAFFFLMNHIYFLLFEEPGLEKRFGREYLEYKGNVPRWIPRFTPWKPQDKEG